MREGYKKTEVGVIPEDWEVGSFKDIIKLRKESFNPLIENNEKYIGLEHIEEKTGRLLGIGESEETSSTKNKFYKGDILFGKLRPYLRKYYIADFNGVCVTEILPLVSINSNNKFCFYKIQEDKFIEYINNITFGTKMPRTSWNDIKDYKLAIPPSKQQEKIAEILSTVDSQINDTEKLIEKSKELKKGLMQKLLTKGIGHSEFKKTEIGEIPASWEVKKLGDIVDIKSGTSPSKFSLTEDGQYPFFKVDDMNYEFKYLNNSKLYFDLCDVNLMKSGMVIFPKRGASIFTNKILILNQDGYFDTNLMGLICKESINNEFLYYSLYYYELSRIADTSSIPQINNKHIEPLKISLPSLEEQCEIVKVLSLVDIEIEEYETKKQKLEELKKGLMQQLLTGKIRVTI